MRAGLALYIGKVSGSVQELFESISAIPKNNFSHCLIKVSKMPTFMWFFGLNYYRLFLHVLQKYLLSSNILGTVLGFEDAAVSKIYKELTLMELSFH